jgi:cellulose synthase/poly-beta-1,6-N-acetylglucosamine synthase-like glycosyltransferase
MIWIVFIAGSIYILVIASFLCGWEKLKVFTPAQSEYKTFVSVIVPMRNEQDTIGGLLGDLCRQTYPLHLLEIIVIDDHSSDKSIQSALHFQQQHVRVMSLPENVKGKKAAIRYGIENAGGDLILSTDADCRVEENWVRCVTEYYEKYSPSLILGPVVASPLLSNKPFYQIQSLELFSLLGSTAGSIANKHAIMCNGANLAFPKSLYSEIKYIYENEKISSGDDMFLLLELKKKYRSKIHYLKSKEAIVNTVLPDNIVSFFRQRKRWAAKAKFYSDYDMISTSLIIFSVNLLLLIAFVTGFIKTDFSCFLILILMKSSIDFLFLLRITNFFRKERIMKWFPIVQSFYFLYVCFTAIAALITPVNWKERITKY